MRKYNMSIEELAKLHGLKSYDIALPQEFVTDMSILGYDVRGQVVWCYDNNSTFGEPYALTNQYKSILEYALKAVS